MRPWYKRPAIVVLGVLGLLVVIVIASSGGSDTDTVATDDTIAPAPTAGDAPTAVTNAPNSRACQIVQGQTVDTFEQSDLLQLQGVLGDDITLEQNSLIAANLDWTTDKAVGESFDRDKSAGQLKDLEDSLC